MKRAQKKKIMGKYSKHGKDTGSAQVQVAILTERINELTKHLKDHKKDNHSRRGLLLMVGKRRKLLNYLKNSKPDVYEDLLKTLKLRKSSHSWGRKFQIGAHPRPMICNLRLYLVPRDHLL